MKELNYYWYHHMMPAHKRDYIHKIIKEHNFLEFIKLYKNWNSYGIINGITKKFEPNEPYRFFPIVYLPDTASYEDENGELQFVNILNEENFKQITFDECECG